jgi:transcriptional regulator with XRE-family HTH domain
MLYFSSAHAAKKSLTMNFAHCILIAGVMKMNTLGERLNYARKQKGYTQDSLARTIGVSRGVIFNLEKNKTEPQAIVINTICQVLKINKEWLTDGTGGMEPDGQALQSTKLLAELYDIAKELSEDEQLFLLDTVKALKLRLGKRL